MLLSLEAIRGIDDLSNLESAILSNYFILST